MPPRSLDKPPTQDSFEFSKLQKQLIQATVDNEFLSQKLETTTSDLNDVVVYLKQTIEEKDDDIARLEEVVAQQEQRRDVSLRKEQEQHAERMRQMEAETNGLRTQIAMISTQLGNQQRMHMEMQEMHQKMKRIKEIVERQKITIDQKENSERAVKIVTTEAVRQEMAEDLRKEIENTKARLQLERDAQLLMNQKMIEHLEKEVEREKSERIAAEKEKEEVERELEEERRKREGAQAERDKTKRLFEKSGVSAEKSLKEMKRRYQDAKNRRLKLFQEKTDITNNLNQQIRELQDLLRNATERCEKMEKVLLKEQKTRAATLAAHSSQNKKIGELKEFLKVCLSGDPAADQVLGESRAAVFAQLSLIVGQIPTVK